MKRTALTIWIILVMILSVSINSTAWSNGGYSDTITSPDYGTHDWIAEKALAMLPASESQYIHDNLDYYLYGTELPDNPDGLFDDGIGDTFQHHVYFDSNGIVTDDASADRAKAMFDDAKTHLQNEDYENASKYAGAMTHYIADLGVFGHVMGSTTFWGAETHHSDYENYVRDHQADFNSYIVFDGTLATLSAYDATIELAHDTTFDDSGAGRDCLWMDAEITEEPVDPPPVDPPPVQAGDPTDLKINEMEQGPAGEDYGYEWVELYNPTSSSIDLSGCQLKNNDGDYKTISGTVPAYGYFVYTFPTQWLDNSDEGVILLYNSNVVDQTPIKDDSANDEMCWARVPNGQDTNSDSDWSYVASTKGTANPSTRAYDWADPDFKARAGESINLAVNLVADVLHTLAVESGYTASDTPPVVDPITPVDPDDTDADGMPDEWEMEQFGELTPDGTGDWDGDGVSDLDEYSAGTDPLVDEAAADSDTEPEAEPPAGETPGFGIWTMLLAMLVAVGIVRMVIRWRK
ncbi:MAG: lamin tail domain-containing protein [Thermoplasmata archaeon]|nr:lamin tail domain-containing protein [Thermoplasmata archaeon]